MNISTKFIVRDFIEKDRDYIVKTILMSHFSGSTCAKKNNRDSFLNGHNKVINALLDHAKTLVIADPEDSDLIYGFIIYEQAIGDYDICHYVHVRKDFRGLGLIKNLIPALKKKDNLALSHVNDDTRPARLKQYYDKVICDFYVQNIKERI